MKDPDTRPKFTSILADLRRMEQDPTRYVTPSAFTPSAKTPKTARSITSRIQTMMTPAADGETRNQSTSEGIILFFEIV